MDEMQEPNEMEAQPETPMQEQQEPVPQQQQEGAPQQGAAESKGKGGPATAEVERGIAAVGKALYQDAGMSDKILAQISDEEKVGSTAKAAIMLVTQMDKQLDLAERAIAAVTVFAADRLMELAEADARNGIQYSDMEAKQVIMTTMEGILKAYGVTPERSAQLAQQVGPDEAKKYQKTYEETLNG